MERHIERGTEIRGYICEERIGSGSFATVWKAKHRETQQMVAIKVVDMTKLSKEMARHLEMEIQITMLLDHVNVVKVIESIDSRTQMIMVLELCDGGDLASYLKQHEHGLDEETVRYFMSQLASGLKALKDHNVFHRDLKPNNILLANKGDRPVLKIADFGFARYVEEESLMNTFCGTPLYMAPEIISHKKYTTKSDMWSMGIILYEMAVGKKPFNPRTLHELTHEVTTKEVDVPENLSHGCANLIRGLLQRDPNPRMSCEELFVNEWINGEEGSVATTTGVQKNDFVSSWFIVSAEESVIPDTKSSLYDDFVILELEFDDMERSVFSNSMRSFVDSATREVQVVTKMAHDYKRIMVIVKLGTHKLERGLIHEAFSTHVYAIRSLHDLAHVLSSYTKKYGLTSSQLSSISNMIVNKVHLYMKVVKMMKPQLDPTKPVPDALEIIKEHTHHMGEATMAANAIKKEKMCNVVILLLETIILDASVPPSEKRAYAGCIKIYQRFLDL